MQSSRRVMRIVTSLMLDSVPGRQMCTLGEDPLIRANPSKDGDAESRSFCDHSLLSA